MMILLIFRDPKRGGTSVEEIYNGLIPEMKKSMDIHTYNYDDQSSLFNNIKAIRRLKSDIIHVTAGVYFIIPFLGKAKKIITIHDIGRYVELTGIKKYIYKWVWLKIPSRLADRIITVSDFTSKELLLNIDKNIFKKIIRIYNPVPKIFTKNEKEINIACPVILHVGTTSNKNLERVADALAGLNCQLTIIGKMSNAQIRRLQQNKINYTNLSGLNYEEVYEQYLRCDIVMFVSTYEGFGMPIIEANAVGRLVICSTTTSLPEIANDAALFVEDVQSSIEIRSKVLSLLEDSKLGSRLIANGFRNIKRFEMDEIIKQYKDLYSSI